jgi:hypothetical protein
VIPTDHLLQGLGRVINNNKRETEMLSIEEYIAMTEVKAGSKPKRSDALIKRRNHKLMKDFKQFLKDHDHVEKIVVYSGD